MNKIKIGKISEQQQKTRGWLVGQFFPENSPFKDDNVEIYHKTFPVGDKSDRLHKHPKGKEYLIVLAGKAIMQIGEEQIELQSGDYITISKNTPDKIIEVLEELTIIGVRYPSIPNNKVLLEE